MKKNIMLGRLLVLMSLPLAIGACDNDDDAAGSTFEFVNVETAYNESAGTTAVTIPLKNGVTVAESDLVIQGTATRGEDWELEGITTEGIQLTIMNDAAAEILETIRFTIPNSTGNAVHTVRIVSDDPGILDIDLTWAAGVESADMDLVLFKLNADEEWEHVSHSWGATFEHVAMDWTDEDGTYGLAYNYYAGEADPLDFTVQFTPTGISLDGGQEPLVFNATYTAANIDDASAYPIVQTFKKEGTAFTDFSEIEVPQTGSRQSANNLIHKLQVAAGSYKSVR
jgi:hypothetical protein